MLRIEPRQSPSAFGAESFNSKLATSSLKITLKRYCKLPVSLDSGSRTKRYTHPVEFTESLNKERRLQKLFCTFPDGRPGFGLLLLRGLVSVTLVTQAVAQLTTGVSLLNLCVAGIALLIAGCLLVGFLTPIVAIVIGLGAVLFAFLDFSLPIQSPVGTLQTLLNVIVLSAVIFFLGPGAFSFDARMFGRREIRIPAVPQPINKQMEV